MPVNLLMVVATVYHRHAIRKDSQSTPAHKDLLQALIQTENESSKKLLAVGCIGR